MCMCMCTVRLCAPVVTGLRDWCARKTQLAILGENVNEIKIKIVRSPHFLTRRKE